MIRSSVETTPGDHKKVLEKTGSKLQDRDNQLSRADAWLKRPSGRRWLDEARPESSYNNLLVGVSFQDMIELRSQEP